MQLSPYSILPYFVLSAGFIALAKLLAHFNPFYKSTNLIHKAAQFEALDGLRGFLALGVFFHHSLINFEYYQTRIWQLPKSQFYTMTGQVGVCFFFVITAFLFWTKIIQNDGLIGWRKLYYSRIKRIMPMYLTSVLVIIVIITYQLLLIDNNYFHSAENTWSTIKQLLNFLFFTQPELPLKDSSTINAGVFWTLNWEWKFYFVLPFLSLFSSKKKFIFFSGLFLFCLLANEKFLYYFLVGMIAAETQYQTKVISKTPKYVFDFVFLTSLILLMTYFDTAYGITQAAITLIAFVSLLKGNGVFGLLLLNSTRILGKISYSIYLWHGIVLTLVISQIPNQMFYQNYYWLIAGLSGALTILLSSFTFEYIEDYFNHQTNSSLKK